MNFFKKKEKGFTLIELMVVIAIIGLLSAVVLASLNNARMKGRDARRISDIRQISAALELYRSDNGGLYPNASIYNANVLAPKYLSSVPRDPSPDTTSPYEQCRENGQYCYAWNTARTSYHLGAQLETISVVTSNDVDGSSTGYNYGFDATLGVGSPDYIYDIRPR